MMILSSSDDEPLVISQPPKRTQNTHRIRRRTRRIKKVEPDIIRKKNENEIDAKNIINLPESVQKPLPPPRKADSEFSEDTSDDDDIVFVKKKIQPENEHEENLHTHNDDQNMAVVITLRQPEKITQCYPNINVPHYSSQPITGTFFIERKKKFHPRSMRCYAFKSFTDHYLSAKEHGLISPDVYINEGSDVHVKLPTQYTHIIKSNIQRSAFTLFDKNDMKSPISTIDYDSNYGESIGPRKIKLTCKDETYKSRIPKRGANGYWKLSFGGHFTILSCRNAILLDSNLKEAIVIRKVGKDVLEITVKKPTPMIDVFLLGITSYIYQE